jgi:hypothetical protein
MTQCRQCGIQFETDRGRGRPRSFCLQCRPPSPYRAQTEPRLACPCETCGVEFHPPTYKSRFCSTRCRGKARGSLCAGGCGRMLVGSSTSLPAGRRTCLDCRRAKVKPKFQPQLRPCRRCTLMFEATRDSQKYCPPCREKRPGFGRKRGPRPSSKQRGYGTAHLRERAKWKLVVDSGRASCCLCGDPIEPGSKWHLDHTPDRSGYRGPAHAACNMRDGARRGRARQDAPGRNRQW